MCSDSSAPAVGERRAQNSGGLLAMRRARTSFQATKLVTMKASSLQALGVGAKVVEVAYMLAKFVF